MVGKKNVVNLLIVVIAVALIVAIALRFNISEEMTLNFSGPNVYRAVYVYAAMQEQGFSVNLKFSGKWTDNNEKIDSEGLILNAELASFTILLNGREVTVGGPFSSIDDIQAVSLSLAPNHRAVVKAGLEPLMYKDVSSLTDKLDKFSASLVPRENISEVGISGDITIDSAKTVMPTIIQELNNALRPGNEYVLFERGLILKLNNANLNDLENAGRLLSREGLDVEKIATGRLEIFIRTKNIPPEGRDVLQGKAENTGLKIFLFKIITKPVQ
ncbi:TPA: hypothetical protein H1016_01065 [archaeon]|uniref:Transcription regulator TrmB C-terminal domain-containing protein n=1 Tax=Candidatus Naiadarchaeum limnaeum TaxID=2756139 RepID=A0A832XGF0_9ARCH|nr:hypothetical protein [Candidatus Naiadarchaeum limnaeum]